MNYFLLQISMNQFLVSFAVNLLNLCLPLGITIYLAIRLAIKHGEISFKRQGTTVLKSVNNYERNREDALNA